MKIAVAGIGYVGLANACLLAQHNDVMLYDISEQKVDSIHHAVSPIKDDYIEKFFAEKTVSLTATTNYHEAFKDAAFILVATPTNYDDVLNHFDTSSVEQTIAIIAEEFPNATAVVKSTVPVGFTQRMREKFPALTILFSPEFLREGKALYDNLYPSRIIVGDVSDKAKEFASLLQRGARKEAVPVLLMPSTEAEAVKLFSNTYLALRIAYFNELDTYAELHGLDTRSIIAGVSLEPRIGDFYNNPSFGYGGYCLPKDTKQLRANYKDVPENLISAIVESNETRKRHIADMILARQPKTVGVYRLTMKADSDNFRASAIQSIMAHLRKSGVALKIYEPTISAATYDGYEVQNDLAILKQECDVIICNRCANELTDVAYKVYTRDLFGKD
ncbi:MAG: nucleotide sugar dehydrogenase [Treponema sp.]|nr:nucleotide sugar dehydrogenase [Treponema sp.]